MGKYSENNLGYYLSLPADHKNYLGTIRNIKNLKIGFDKDRIWVKDFSREQINSAAIRAIPFIERYYEKENQLFLLESLLPACKIPSVLWTPIQRGLSIELPSLNHNYFGCQGSIALALIDSFEEQEPFAMKIAVHQLEQYINTASAIRLKPLRWVIFDEEALVIGTPLLPLQGQILWQRDHILIPAGKKLNYPSLAEDFQHQIKSKGNYILFTGTSSYTLIERSMFQPLTISSFRNTFMH